MKLSPQSLRGGGGAMRLHVKGEAILLYYFVSTKSLLSTTLLKLCKRGVPS